MKDIDWANVYNNIGVILGALGKHDQAIDKYKLSIDKCGESVIWIPYSNLIKLYLALGRIASAEALLNTYIGKDPKNYSPLLVLADYYYKKGEFKNSCDILEKILAKHGDDTSALTLMASIYGEYFDDLNYALELSKKAYSSNNSDEDIANNLAYAYLRNGKLQEAKQILEKRSWKKGYFFAIATKGLLNILEGNIKQGVRLYDEAERLAWNTEWKRLVRQKKYVELGRNYLVSGDIQNAKKELNSALSVKAAAKIYSLQAKRLMSKIS